MSQQQGNRTWVLTAVLVILGLTVGLGLGLVIGWVVLPVKYVDTAIADLGIEAKEEYILLVASAYACDGDLEEAQARLSLLEAPNINQWVADMADRYIVEGRDAEDIEALATLAQGLGVASAEMMAYVATPTPPPTAAPSPTPTPMPSATPTATLRPTDVPTAEPQPSATQPPPTNTPPQAPTNTPPPPPTNTPPPPTATARPPTNTPKPKPTNPPPPTNTPKPPAAKWTIIEQRLVGPGEDGQECGGGGNLLLRVRVVDAQGNQIGGVWIRNPYTGIEQVTGHKAGDAGWGIGDAEFVGAGGGKLCIITGPGGDCESEYTRDMPCRDMPPFEDMWAAGYCNCCEPNITKERCRQLVNEGKCLGTGHYTWRVTFQRSY